MTAQHTHTHTSSEEHVYTRHKHNFQIFHQRLVDASSVSRTTGSSPPACPSGSIFSDVIHHLWGFLTSYICLTVGIVASVKKQTSTNQWHQWNLTSFVADLDSKGMNLNLISFFSHFQLYFYSISSFGHFVATIFVNYGLITFKFPMKFRVRAAASGAEPRWPDSMCQEIRMMASMALRGSDGPKWIYGHARRLKWTPT